MGDVRGIDHDFWLALGAVMTELESAIETMGWPKGISEMGFQGSCFRFPVVPHRPLVRMPIMGPCATAEED